MRSDRAAFERALALFDDEFRHDAGAALGRWYTHDAQLLWPEEPAIIGPEAIGAAFAEFAELYETLSFEPRHELVDVVPPLAVVVGPFIETRRERTTGEVERVHGRMAHAWRVEPEHGWRITRTMTSRSAASDFST